MNRKSLLRRFVACLVLVASGLGLRSPAVLLAQPAADPPADKQPADQQPPEEPSVAEPLTADPLPDGTEAARRQIAAFRVPAGLRVELFAAEPQLGNPVALTLDERNRVFVAEEYRFNRGTEENRTRAFLLDDDLEVRTLDDRRAMYAKHLAQFSGGWEWFTRYTDQLRLLEDADRDGLADRSTVFSNRFHDALDGMLAGVLVKDGDVYATCIPKLWRLRDRDGDGKADEHETLLEGFGVNAAFLGHDLHGLTWGPDGFLYFSVGDRGFHVKTKEGPVLATARRGAVFRCRPDGRELEVVHTGLRNPQEIAFDDYGNLFAADNNCDRGDHSRLVYVVDGGDSGWNMAYQTIPEPYPTGPWHAERMWYVDGDPAAEGIQPAWVLPPVGKLGAGPSGFAHYPGLGLPPRYRDHFFLCNYTGAGGIESFKVEPHGAGFQIVDAHDFLKPIFATDAEFGYDGQLYVSDFVGLEWNGGSKGGRVYRLFDPELRDSPEVQHVRSIFADGFTQRENDELAQLLRSRDQRVRLRAQFELAARGMRAAGVFATLLQQRDERLTRLHALWGFGQLVRDGHAEALQLLNLKQLLNDEDEELRAQTAKWVGDCRVATAGDLLIERLRDSAPRVRFFAAQSLGRLKHAAAVEPLWQLVRDNRDSDRYVRYACIVALTRMGDEAQAATKVRDAEASVHRAATVVLRRQNDPRVASFLNDADLAIAAEAARAVHDLRFTGEPLAALAQQIERLAASPEGWPEALTRRVVNANFRLARLESLSGLARLAGDSRTPEPLRRDALDALVQALNPPRRDRVTWESYPPPTVEQATLRAAVQPHIADMLASAPAALQAEVAKLIQPLELDVNDATFVSWTKDVERAPSARLAALQLLGQRQHPDYPQLVERLLADRSSTLRAAARELVAKEDAARGEQLYRAVLEGQASATDERQRAIVGVAKLKTAGADALLRAWAERLANGEVEPALQLDVVESLAVRGLEDGARFVQQFQQRSARGDALDRFRTALAGGDAVRGRELFQGHRVAQCVRCHKVAGQGGDAGPDLSQVAKRHERAGLLESLVDPNAKIAAEFGTVSLVLESGRIVAGTIVLETPETIELRTAEGTRVKVAVDQVEDRSPPRSAMPAMDRTLTLRELRDVVEYLSSLR
ncbi:MAG: PVC-type heme-binding CxxCH protein [Pirellulales bacterium]